MDGGSILLAVLGESERIHIHYKLSDAMMNNVDERLVGALPNVVTRRIVIAGHEDIAIAARDPSTAHIP